MATDHLRGGPFVAADMDPVPSCVHLQGWEAKLVWAHVAVFGDLAAELN